MQRYNLFTKQQSKIKKTALKIKVQRWAKFPIPLFHYFELEYTDAIKLLIIFLFLKNALPLQKNAIDYGNNIGKKERDFKSSSND